MRQALTAAVAVAMVCASAFSQTKRLGEGPNRMELSLDRHEGAAWRAVDPGLVFAKDDRVRFRFRANFDGYLYVMNQGTSGNYETLFPRQDTGEQNRIEAGVEYVVPATRGWFRISGPPGHDILYWMVTPLPLGSQPKYTPLPPPPKSGPVPPSLTPRCDDTIWKARGECIDSSAGSRGVRGDRKLPENLSAAAGAASRELFFIRDKNLSIVASPGPLRGPVVYEFRLAHK